MTERPAPDVMKAIETVRRIAELYRGYRTCLRQGDDLHANDIGDDPEQLELAASALVAALSQGERQLEICRKEIREDDGLFAQFRADLATARREREDADKATAMYCGAFQKARDEATALRSQVEQLEAQADALAVKVLSLSEHHTCGCSYDTKDSVCMHHSPQLVAALSRVEQMEKALRALVDYKDDPCRLDHHGNCQEHYLGNPCEVAEARKLLASLPSDASGAPNNGM